MKKLSIVLIAFLLVAGTAFADEHMDFSGEAKVEFEVDFADEEAKIINTTELNMEYVYTIFSETKSSAGSPPIWAEIIGTADLYYDIEIEDSAANPDTSGGSWELDLEIDSAKVYFDELGLWIDILGAPDEFQFAEAVIDDWVDENSVEASFGDGDGVTIGYMDYEVGLYFISEWGIDQYNFVSSVKTPSIALAPGLTAQLMAALDLDQDDANFSVGFDADYVMDGMEFKVAGDFVDNFDAFDALFIADVAPVTVSLYYIHNVPGGAAVGDDIFEAMVEIALEAEGIDELSAGVENQMQMDDFKNKTELYVDFTIDALTAKVFGNFTVADELEAWEVGAEAGYTVDDWTFGGEVALEWSLAQDAIQVPFKLSVTSSDRFVDNANIFAEYEYNDWEGTSLFTTGISMSF